jgi:hypothetical protein
MFIALVISLVFSEHASNTNLREITIESIFLSILSHAKINWKIVACCQISKQAHVQWSLVFHFCIEVGHWLLCWKCTYSFSFRLVLHDCRPEAMEQYGKLIEAQHVNIIVTVLPCFNIYTTFLVRLSQRQACSPTACMCACVEDRQVGIQDISWNSFPSTGWSLISSGVPSCFRA